MLKSKLFMFLCFAGLSLLLVSATRMRFPQIITTMMAPLNKPSMPEKKLTVATKLDFSSLSDKQALRFVHNYIRHNDQGLTDIKERSEVPFGIIDSVFAQYGLPLDLKYVAVVESELKTSALSRVGAKGPWQLMPRTAHILGLKVNRHVDERTSYYKSTRAAARYLRDLHREFGDWLLALAAYNGGANQVHRAIRKSHSRNFWVLQKYLPRESRLYVKKFIATDYYFETLAKENEALDAEQLPASNDGKANVPTMVRIESSDEKFNRLMRESAVSMQKSKDLLDCND